MSTSEPIIGTSDKVINTIADNCGIKYIGVKTSDSQEWWPKNRKNHEFAVDTAKRGYINDESCLQLAYDLDNVLIYANIAESKQPTGLFLTAKYAENSYNVTDFRIKNDSGLMNNLNGYAEDVRKQSLLSLDSELFDTVKLVRISQKIMMDSKIYNSIKQSRVFFRPIDSGSLHENYELAYYQNRRIAGTYALGIEVIVNQPTKNVKLLDCVEYTTMLQDGLVTAYSGKFIVTSRVIYIQGINYFEKLELTRQGLNSNAPTQM
jgi:hypothetical protein